MREWLAGHSREVRKIDLEERVEKLEQKVSALMEYVEAIHKELSEFNQLADMIQGVAREANKAIAALSSEGTE